MYEAKVKKGTPGAAIGGSKAALKAHRLCEAKNGRKEAHLMPQSPPARIGQDKIAI